MKNPTSEVERWLLDTVRRQSEQVGIKMPQVAIYDAPDINAFATGARRDASLVAVSTGLLASMSRDRSGSLLLPAKLAMLPVLVIQTMTLLQRCCEYFRDLYLRIIAQFVANFISSDEERKTVTETHGIHGRFYGA